MIQNAVIGKIDTKSLKGCTQLSGAVVEGAGAGASEGGGAEGPRTSEDQGIGFHCSHLNLLRLTSLSSVYAEGIVCLNGN